MEQRDPLSLNGEFKLLSDSQEQLILYTAITVVDKLHQTNPSQKAIS
jgi:hypothetical protein